MRQRAIGLAALLVLALGLPAVAFALGIAKRRHPTRTRRSLTARSVMGTPAVGALFSSASDDEHICTASVVKSPQGDLLITAAHCISASAVGMVFAPGYSDGREPYGLWVVTGAHLAPGWLDSQDPHEDYALLTVAPRQIDGRRVEIQQLTGGYRLGSTPRAHTLVTVSGYPGGSGGLPITCTAPTYLRKGFPAFDCGGYVGGTSGSPWVARTAQGMAIVGVIGGLHQGGCRAAVSYSPPLGAAARALYRRTIDGAGSDLAPRPRPDGCPS